MAVAVQTLRIELGGAAHDFPVLSMLDRRKRSSVRKQWCLVRATELLLFNVQDRSRGRFAAHLAKMSMEGGVLVAEGPVVMPHQGAWSTWADSSFVPATLVAGQEVTVTIGDGFNMSYLEHYRPYVAGNGGGGGGYNYVNVAELKLLFRG